MFTAKQKETILANIEAKYGKEVVEPNLSWEDEKELAYGNELIKLDEKISKKPGKKDFVESYKRVCSYCDSLSYKSRDSFYLFKFQACKKCYIKNIEGKRVKNKNQQG